MKYLTAAEVRELGVLQEVNRLLLHPRGLALEVYCWKVEGDNSFTASLRVQDHRDDPEGVYFGDLDDEARWKAQTFVRLEWERSPSRIERLGYVVQPFDADYEQSVRDGYDEQRARVAALVEQEREALDALAANDTNGGSPC